MCVCDQNVLDGAAMDLGSRVKLFKDEGVVRDVSKGASRLVSLPAASVWYRGAAYSAQQFPKVKFSFAVSTMRNNVRIAWGPFGAILEKG